MSSVLSPTALLAFVVESNKIEGIYVPPEDKELAAYRALLFNGPPTEKDLTAFVAVVQPGARLRDKEGLNIRIGYHLPLRGGPLVKTRLDGLLLSLDKYSPYLFHCEYEDLHPYTDGNGRSGRALWLWQMLQAPTVVFNRYSFLQTWYYQSLSAHKHK